MKKLLFFCFLALFFVVINCTFTLGQEIKNGNKTDTLRFATIFMGARGSRHEHAFLPINDYIEQSTQFKVKSVFPKDKTEFIEFVEEGKIDFGFLDPINYVELKDSGKIELLGKFVAKGPSSPGLKGLIIAPASTTITENRESLRGKKLVVKNLSLSLYENITQAYLLQKNGINVRTYFSISEVAKKISFEKIIKMIASAEADVAFIPEVAFYEVSQNSPEMTNKIKIIAETPVYPDWAVFARVGLPIETQEKLKTIIPNLPKIYFNDGFMEAEDSEYDSIRELLTKCEYIKSN